MLRCIIRALGSSTQDDVDILIAPCLDYGREALLRHTHKGMGVGAGAHSIDSDSDTAMTVGRHRNLNLWDSLPAVCAVLETDGEGDTRGKLTVEL